MDSTSPRASRGGSAGSMTLTYASGACRLTSLCKMLRIEKTEIALAAKFNEVTKLG